MKRLPDGFAAEQIGERSNYQADFTGATADVRLSSQTLEDSGSAPWKFAKEVVMLVRDVLPQSSRSKEDEHFRKKDSEWIKKMQKQAAREVERGQMGDEIGVADPKILQDLQELGYSRDTVKLVYLVPLVQVAWSEGHVTQRERKRILELAQLRCIEEGSLAYSQLTEWLSQRPRLEFFERTLSVIREPAEGHAGRTKTSHQGRSRLPLHPYCCNFRRLIGVRTDDL